MSTAPSTPTWIALAEADDGFLGIEGQETPMDLGLP
jgi:hypothetical protein